MAKAYFIVIDLSLSKWRLFVSKYVNLMSRKFCFSFTKLMAGQHSDGSSCELRVLLRETLTDVSLYLAGREANQ